MDFVVYNQQINIEHLAGKSWLFLGEENYMMQNMLAKTKEMVLKPMMMPMNYVEIEASSIRAKDLEELYQTLPMMDEVRLVVIKHGDELVKHPEIDGLLALFEKVPQHVISILIDTYDGIKKTTKLYKRHQRQNTVVEFGKLTPTQFQGFMNKNLAEVGLKASPNTITRLMQLSGYGGYGSDINLYDIKQALDKVASLGSKGMLQFESFIPYWPTDKRAGIFAFIDALFGNNKGQTLDLYQLLFDQQEPPLKMLAMITRHVRLWRRLQILKKEGYGSVELKSNLGISDYEFRKLTKLPMRSDLDLLTELLEDTELKMKSTGGDQQIMLEMLISQIILLNEQKNKTS